MDKMHQFLYSNLKQKFFDQGKRVELPISDLFRFKVTTMHEDKLMEALEIINKNFKVTRLKNKLNSPLH